MASSCKALCQSRTIGLGKQLTLLNRGSQPVIDYLATIRDIVDEPNLLGVPIPNQYLITHTLNGVDPKFKEIVVVVQAWDTMITFDELHNKLVEYEAFLKWEELCSTGNLGIITVNNAQFSSSNSEKKPSIKYFPNRKDNKANALLIAGINTLARTPLWYAKFGRKKVILLASVTLLRNCFFHPQLLPIQLSPPTIPQLIGSWILDNHTKAWMEWW